MTNSVPVFVAMKVTVRDRLPIVVPYSMVMALYWQCLFDVFLAFVVVVAAVVVDGDDDAAAVHAVAAVVAVVVAAVGRLDLQYVVNEKSKVE